MEKTAWKIRNLVEAINEEEISLHEQTAQNLVIETGIESIESTKRNYNDTTLSQNALR
jgi:predicted membrane GTPase involved in stress response